jgi:hypothetical protein
LVEGEWFVAVGDPGGVMAVYNDYTVQFYDAGSSAWVDVTDVQSLSCFVGRDSAAAEFQVSTTSVSARYPGGFVAPYAGLTLGSWFRWAVPGRDVDVDGPSWVGVVADVTVEFGVPWDGSSTGVEDVISLQCEGGLSIWGRDDLTLIGNPNLSMQEILDQVDQPTTNTSIPNVAAAAIAYQRVDPIPALSWLQKATASIQGIIQDGIEETSDGSPSVRLLTQSQITVSDVSFSDTTNDSSHRVYSEIGFDGLGENYFTRVTVIPEQVAKADASVGSAPFRQLNVDTINAATSVAQSIANGLLAQFGTPVIGLSRLSARTSGQQTQNLDTMLVSGVPPLGDLIGRRVEVAFRGQTLYAEIVGVRVSADLNETVFTYSLAPAEAVFWFTLDSTEFGELDDDRLAFL